MKKLIPATVAVAAVLSAVPTAGAEAATTAQRERAVSKFLNAQLNPIYKDLWSQDNEINRAYTVVSRCKQARTLGRYWGMRSRSFTCQARVLTTPNAVRHDCRILVTARVWTYKGITGRTYYAFRGKLVSRSVGISTSTEECRADDQERFNKFHR